MTVFIRLAFFPGATQEHFDALDGAMRDAPQPPGRLLFAAGPVDSGWQVVQVWTSRDDLAVFNETHFLPALAALGPGAFPAGPVVTDLEPVVLAGRAFEGAGWGGATPSGASADDPLLNRRTAAGGSTAS